jgi:hypothetical protein
MLDAANSIADHESILQNCTKKETLLILLFRMSHFPNLLEGVGRAYAVL